MQHATLRCMAYLGSRNRSRFSWRLSYITAAEHSNERAENRLFVLRETKAGKPARKPARKCSSMFVSLLIVQGYAGPLFQRNGMRQGVTGVGISVYVINLRVHPIAYWSKSSCHTTRQPISKTATCPAHIASRHRRRPRRRCRAGASSTSSHGQMDRTPSAEMRMSSQIIKLNFLQKLSLSSAFPLRRDNSPGPARLAYPSVPRRLIADQRDTRSWCKIRCPGQEETRGVDRPSRLYICDWRIESRYPS